jgi:HEAT repeat protein
MLNDPDENIQCAAIDSLGEGKIDGAIPAILHLAHCGTSHVRYWSLLALGKIGKSQKNVLDTLRKALVSSDPSLRLASLKAIGRLGVAASSLISSILPLAQDPDFEVSMLAATAFKKVMPNSLESIRVLLRALAGNSSSETATLIKMAISEVLVKIVGASSHREKVEALLMLSEDAPDVLAVADPGELEARFRRLLELKGEER